MARKAEVYLRAMAQNLTEWNICGLDVYIFLVYNVNAIKTMSVLDC